MHDETWRGQSEREWILEIQILKKNEITFDVSRLEYLNRRHYEIFHFLESIEVETSILSSIKFITLLAEINYL